jgi:hypothetical protein
MKDKFLSLLIAVLCFTAKAQDSLNVSLMSRALTEQWDHAYAVATRLNYAYVAAGNSGLRIVDISNPNSPVQAGFYDTPGFALGVAAGASYAYIADGANGLRVIEVGDPASAAEVGFLDTPGFANGVAVAGNYAYVADGSSLRVINVSNPAAPSQTGSAPVPAVGVAVQGNYAYVAAGGAGLRIIDIAIRPHRGGRFL